jgi:hypothetical protein
MQTYWKPFVKPREATGKIRRHVLIPDIVSLWALTILVFLFYYPKDNPLNSRYLYFADMIERALSLCNPEYGNEFHRYNWETISPLATFITRVSMQFLHENPAAAVLAAHFGVVLIAIVALYLLNRLYLSATASFCVTALMFFGRTLLPLSRGLGVTVIHLLVPFSLAAVYGISVVMERTSDKKRRTAHVAIASMSLAVIYIIGSHETFYAGICMVIAGAILVGRWLYGSIRAKRVLPGPAAAFSSNFLIAAVLGFAAMTAIHFSVPAQQKPEPLWRMILYANWMKGAAADVSSESFNAPADKLLVLAGTFAKGKYLTRHGNHHENTFLYPGPGFNGIVPLFLLPGLLLGLVRFSREAKRSLRNKEDPLMNKQRYFLFFIFVLMLFFLMTVVASSDPKPTRYTYSIYAVYVIGVWGYESLPDMIERIKKRLFKRGEELSSACRQAPSEADVESSDATARFARYAVVVFLLIFVGLHLRKNYSDLEMYIEGYAHQMPAIYIDPLFEKAVGASGGEETAIVYAPLNKHANITMHPSLGIRQNCMLPPNVRVIYDPDEIKRIPEKTKLVLIRPEGLPPESLYYVPTWDWPR